MYNKVTSRMYGKRDCYMCIIIINFKKRPGLTIMVNVVEDNALQ